MDDRVKPLDFLNFKARRRYPNINPRPRRQAVFADWKSRSIPVRCQPTLPHSQPKTQNTKGLLCLNAG